MILKYQRSKSKKIGKAKKIWLLGIGIHVITIRSSKGSEYIWIKKSKNKNRYKRISITSSSVATGILIFIKTRESRIEQISQPFKTSLGGIIERKVKRYSQKICLSYVHVREEIPRRTTPSSLSNIIHSFNDLQVSHPIDN